jgi:hypothetical protein
MMHQKTFSAREESKLNLLKPNGRHYVPAALTLSNSCILYL